MILTFCVIYILPPDIANVMAKALIFRKKSGMKLIFSGSNVIVSKTLISL
jgi:hypothetical protein